MKRDKNGIFMKANATKSNITFSVTKNGKPLDESLYIWNEKTKTFSSKENGLVLDFKGIDGVTFKTSYNCTFTTGSGCTFTTENNCTFTTGNNCTFTADSKCIFDTSSGCIFKTGSDCTFYTGDYCTFKTGSCCTFTTCSDCIFKTGSCCTFNTSHNCTFNTGYWCTFKTSENCFITRWDIEGVIEVPIGKTIKLKKLGIAGYTIIEEKKESLCTDKIIEIDGNKYKLVKI